MQHTKRYTCIISSVGMIILLIAAYFFDNWSYALKHGSFESVKLYLWLIPILSLLLATGFLVLFWFVVCQGKRSFVICILFAAVGISMMMVPTLAYTFGWARYLPLFMEWPGYGRWFFLAASAILAAIGVLGILLPKQRAE